MANMVLKTSAHDINREMIHLVESLFTGASAHHEQFAPCLQSFQHNTILIAQLGFMLGQGAIQVKGHKLNCH